MPIILERPSDSVSGSLLLFIQGRIRLVPVRPVRSYRTVFMLQHIHKSYKLAVICNHFEHLQTYWKPTCLPPTTVIFCIARG